jgi:FKBP-type peptidyl-prolyl cis-trans isomerase
MKPIFLITVTLGVVGGILFITFLARTGEPKEDNKQTQNTMPTQEQNEQAPTELKIEDITVGAGEEARTGNTVSVHYKGTLLNGTTFDSSYDRGTPFSFTLGQNSVIQGWERGILGMRVGGKRKLVIPSDLAYGPRAIGLIPANSTLIFEVTLLDIK